MPATDQCSRTEETYRLEHPECEYTYTFTDIPPAELYRIEIRSEYRGEITVFDGELVQPDTMRAGRLPSFIYAHRYWPGVHPKGPFA